MQATSRSGPTAPAADSQQASRACGERFRRLFESIDEGFCVVELYFDEQGRPFDYAFLEVNPAFERQTGLTGVTGKTMRSVGLGTDQHRLDKVGEVARTGREMRFENHVPALEGRWFDVRAFPIDAPELNRVAILFTDITDRKLEEQRRRDMAAAASFRLEMAQRLRPLADPEQIQLEAVRVLGRHLQANRVFYLKLDEDGHSGVVSADYCADAPSMAGRYALDDYGPLVVEELRRGKTLVVSDVKQEPRLTELEQERTAALMIEAYVSIPLKKDDRLVALLVVQQSHTRDWTPAEVSLIEETAEQTWAAVERASVEEELRRVYRHASSILESIADCVYVLDPQRRFTYVNKQAEAYFKRSKSAMLGRRYDEVFPQTRGHEVLQYQDAAANGREAVRSETLSPVTGQWVELSVYPMDDGGLTVYFRDISDRIATRARQDALVELGDRLRVLTDPAAIARTAAEIVGRTLGAIRAGYGAVHDEQQRMDAGQEWVAEGVNTVVEPVRLEDYWTGFADSLRDGRVVIVNDVETDPRVPPAAADNFLAWEVRAFVNVPVISSGRLVAIFYVQFRHSRMLTASDSGFVRDVTDRTWAAVERARADAALRESDQRKDEFLAMLAHELRNPLAAIGNAVHLLEHQRADEQSCRYIRMLNRQTSLLRGLVADLLDVSRITRGLVELAREPVNLSLIVEHALESVRGVMAEKNHSVSLELPDEVLIVFGDPVRLEQIIINLLTNAAKYTDPGGRILLQLFRQGERAELLLKDNGIGLSADVLDRIFDLFGQAERGLARSEGGLGIGLTIVKNLVELHGGQIEARSAGLGRGAEFQVSLPLSRREPAPAARISPAGSHSDEARRVMLVEDSEDVAETMVLLLELAGHQVASVQDGPSALELAGEFQPEVILLDIGLPGMDGYELARRLRANPDTRGAVMAALTGYGQPADRERTRAAGFDEHFVKPVDLNALQEFVSSSSNA
ncbi:GAF domain-containing protein [Gilvimarinus sp. F26214L]|uniref:GAF domain-containing protein n=1 Tax=Gilvimarinus sp. DZF01 TaxID=3461371 RepID=UPI0040456E25